MSERGSFCTQFFYCNKCLALAERVIGKKQIDRIISGFIGGMYIGEEAHAAADWAMQMAPEVCKDCSIVFVVLPDDTDDSTMFTLFQNQAWSRKIRYLDPVPIYPKPETPKMPELPRLPAEMPPRKPIADLLYTGRNKKP